MDLDSPNAPYSVPGPGHRFEGSTDRHIFQSRVCKQKHRLFWPVAPATPGRLSKQSLEGPGDPGSVVDMIYIYIHIYIYQKLSTVNLLQTIRCFLPFLSCTVTYVFTGFHRTLFDRFCSGREAFLGAGRAHSATAPFASLRAWPPPSSRVGAVQAARWVRTGCPWQGVGPFPSSQK